MPIDNCTHSFEDLTDTILPDYFGLLEKSIELELQANVFKGFQSVTKKLLLSINQQQDFPGCYVFINETKPIYVGISRNVVKRLVQHLNHNSHYSASLVYRMASHQFPHTMKRDQAMMDIDFQQAFQACQGKLKEMKVAYVEIGNDLELYLFEVFASMKLDTCRWNTFKTH